jgi:hypothetical protein
MPSMVRAVLLSEERLARGLSRLLAVEANVLVVAVVETMDEAEARVAMHQAEVLIVAGRQTHAEELLELERRHSGLRIVRLELE